MSIENNLLNKIKQYINEYSKELGLLISYNLTTWILSHFKLLFLPLLHEYLVLIFVMLFVLTISMHILLSNSPKILNYLSFACTIFILNILFRIYFFKYYVVDLKLISEKIVVGSVIKPNITQNDLIKYDSKESLLMSAQGDPRVIWSNVDLIENVYIYSEIILLLSLFSILILWLAHFNKLKTQKKTN